jgi:hypothetical protein
MDEPEWLDRLERARKLYTTPHAVAILLGLHDSKQPDHALPPNTEPKEITDALHLLTCLDLVHTDATGPFHPHSHISFTARGQQLAAVLSDGDDEDRILLTTPHAVEMLFGIRNGKHPTQAVPPGTDPREVACAMQLLERLDLIG